MKETSASAGCTWHVALSGLCSAHREEEGQEEGEGRGGVTVTISGFNVHKRGSLAHCTAFEETEVTVNFLISTLSTGHRILERYSPCRDLAGVGMIV